ncbi:hypothetical protein HZH66_004364 [Vespula vulgaris]|uniref:Uncharacterized protein n=1 Tax=Vespula vulgaris TaxID=7454 RepID=A0A834KEX9_VESVU|nr:hypothetical protein HZH66_004364 [Vespula vulgaris]
MGVGGDEGQRRVRVQGVWDSVVGPDRAGSSTSDVRLGSVETSTAKVSHRKRCELRTVHAKARARTIEQLQCAMYARLERVDLLPSGQWP